MRVLYMYSMVEEGGLKKRLIVKTTFAKTPATLLFRCLIPHLRSVQLECPRLARDPPPHAPRPAARVHCAGAKAAVGGAEPWPRVRVHPGVLVRAHAGQSAQTRHARRQIGSIRPTKRERGRPQAHRAAAPRAAAVGPPNRVNKRTGVAYCEVRERHACSARVPGFHLFRVPGFP